MHTLTTVKLTRCWLMNGLGLSCDGVVKVKKNFTPCCAHHSVTCCYSANGRRAEYCDEHVCVSLCVFLWTSPEVPDFLHLLTIIVARSSSDSVTMYFWFCEWRHVCAWWLGIGNVRKAYAQTYSLGGSTGLGVESVICPQRLSHGTSRGRNQRNSWKYTDSENNRCIYWMFFTTINVTKTSVIVLLLYPARQTFCLMRPHSFMTAGF